MPAVMVGVACAFCVCSVRVAKVEIVSNTSSITVSVFFCCILYPSLKLSFPCPIVGLPFESFCKNRSQKMLNMLKTMRTTFRKQREHKNKPFPAQLARTLLVRECLYPAFD